MADATTDKPADSEAAEAGDERLAHRGPIQTLLTRPEIGAMLGLVGVGVMFWLVAGQFGTVGGIANYLDTAAILGIMAVPVALLMIGGEFDLSSGAMTGATAMVVVLLSIDPASGGAGLNLFLAVPLALALAMFIGWFNGTVVDKTSLPSFIVTLGTFFIIWGGKLGFAKLFTDKVIVGDGGQLKDAGGFDFWSSIFGAEWVRNPLKIESGEIDESGKAILAIVPGTGHLWDGRDWAWAGLLILGGAALLLGVLELTYRRRGISSPTGIILSLLGAAAAAAGFAYLLTQGGSASEWGGGVLIGAGVLVGVVGWCMARYQPADRGAAVAADATGLMYRLGAGALAIVLGVVLALVMDSGDSDRLGFLGGAPGRAVFAIGIGVAGVLAVLVAMGRIRMVHPLIGAAIMFVPAVSFLVTGQAARVLLFGGLAGAGVLLLASSARRSRMPLAISLLSAVAVVVLAFFIQAESSSRKLRVELFVVLLLIALIVAASAVARHMCATRQSSAPAAEFGLWAKIGAIVGLAGLVVFAIIEIADGDGIIYSIVIGIAKGALIAFGVYAVGAFYRMLFTRDEGAGRSVVVVGAGLVALSFIVRLLFITTSEALATNARTGFRVPVLVLLLYAAAGTWLLTKTQFGNWIFAVGGNKEAARSVGVPAARTKTTLFMLVSASAWLAGMLIAFRQLSVQADVGNGDEFRYIIVAVVGGNLLTGGYGSALGAAIGAIIWGMISQGIGFALWNSNWQFLVLGALLLLAVIANNYIRGRAEKAPVRPSAAKPDQAEITIVVPAEPASGKERDKR